MNIWIVLDFYYLKVGVENEGFCYRVRSYRIKEMEKKVNDGL